VNQGFELNLTKSSKPHKIIFQQAEFLGLQVFINVLKMGHKR